ncbi:hypothetical protein GOP47_0003023 [Adiantum capillus-veneris]|uniref:Uncharacterized protein n=1 Tax=Adiantum capillus-veneris TaxID=13818 RepID=A0A9D4VB72_ADICA|nr:hypothetical protein GOP47_0003023 [Adiantum capillus-veneris]
MVQPSMERCVLMKMSREEFMEALAKHAHIDPFGGAGEGKQRVLLGLQHVAKKKTATNERRDPLAHHHHCRR